MTPWLTMFTDPSRKLYHIQLQHHIVQNISALVLPTYLRYPIVQSHRVDLCRNRDRLLGSLCLWPYIRICTG